MRLAARTEGIFLDPTYTARALSGLIARSLAEASSAKTALFSCTPEGCRDCLVSGLPGLTVALGHVRRGRLAGSTAQYFST